MRRGAKALREWTNKSPPLKRISSRGKLEDADGEIPTHEATGAASAGGVAVAGDSKTGTGSDPVLSEGPSANVDTGEANRARRKHHDSEVITMSNGATLEVFADGRKIQRSPDGTVIEIYKDGTKVQTSPSGIKIEVRPNGSKVQTNQDGSVLEIQPDGFTRQTSPDGTVVETRTDGSRWQRNPNGVVITVFADGSRTQVFPDGTLIEVKPSGEKLQTNPDGSRLEITVEGVIRPRSATKESISRAEEIKASAAPTVLKTTAVSPATTGSSTRDLASKFESKSKTETSRPTPVRTATTSNTTSASPSKSRFYLRRNSSEAPKAAETELQRENTRLKDTLKMIESKAAEDLASLRSKMQSDMQALVQEVEESREKAQQANKLESALLDATAELERTKKDLDSVVSANTEELAELKLKIIKAEADAAGVESGFERRLREETESLHAQIRDLELATKRSAEEMQNNGNDASAELAVMGTKLAAAENRARELEAETEQMRGALQRHEKAAKEAKADADAQRQTLSSIRETLQAAETEQQALHAQIEDLIFKGGSCAEQLTDLRKERDAAVAEREAAYVKLGEMTKKMVETVSSLTERENELTDAFTEIRQLRENADAKSVDKALSVERERAQELEAKLRTAQASIASDAAAGPELNDQLDAAKRKHQEQERVIASLEKRVETFDVAFSKAKEMNANSMEHLRHRLQHAELQCNELQLELDEANQERDQLHAKLATASTAAEAKPEVKPPSATNASSSSPLGANANDNSEKVAKMQSTVEDLRVQLAKRDREIASQRAHIEKLEKVQAAPALEAIAPIAPTHAGPTPARPPMNALLGQIQAGKSLNAVTADEPVRPGGSPVPGGLLAAIQGGAKLKKSPAASAAKPAGSRVGPSKAAAPSFAELCQLKAKQRADKTQRIDDLLANKKSAKPAVQATGAVSELQAALARRKKASSAAG
ncbi:Centromere protein J [Hondaea fermentalgiana]|uniref:Centromere protein J n=1 Tax=Hondaea fermentalgiana TaxID=2315210 RepID=A0A2R5GIR8_9STRA|nr:Centromere protein J [Hondaea fermentalgiana]|eukprot:GBG30787.1 Centromere protein J [Hondaea fermentalgiana]